MDIPSSEVFAQVEAISKSEAFMPTKRGRQLLRYLVEAAIHNVPKASLKEVVIGVDVFGRPPNYNPKKDSIVRVTIRDLRERITTYYETEGRADPIRIDIPQGSYCPAVYYDPAVANLKLTDRAAMCASTARAAFERRTLQGFDVAFKYLDMALEECPHHPRLLSLKAMAHGGVALYGKLARTELEAAEVLIQQAKRSEYEPWERPLVEAWVKTALYFDWAGGDLLFQRAIALSHGAAENDHWYTAYLNSQLRFDESIRIAADAVAHSAFDRPFPRAYLALHQIMAGKLAEAEETLRITSELFPEAHFMTNIYWAFLHEAKGDFEAAARAIEQVQIGLPDSTIALGLRPLMIGLAGDRNRAGQLYAELKAIKRSGEVFIPASQLANAAIGVGDDDGAVAWFHEAAVTERDPFMNWLAVLPYARHLFHDQRYQTLVTDTMKLRFPVEVPRSAAHITHG